MKHEVRRRLQMRFQLRAKAAGFGVRQIDDMPPTTHSKVMKPARKRSRRGGAAFRRGQKTRS